jgi:predicted peroxiredoxin
MSQIIATAEVVSETGTRKPVRITAPTLSALAEAVMALDAVAVTVADGPQLAGVDRFDRTVGEVLRDLADLI